MIKKITSLIWSFQPETKFTSRHISVNLQQWILIITLLAKMMLRSALVVEVKPIHVKETHQIQTPIISVLLTFLMVKNKKIHGSSVLMNVLIQLLVSLILFMNNWLKIHFCVLSSWTQRIQYYNELQYWGINVSIPLQSEEFKWWCERIHRLHRWYHSM